MTALLSRRLVLPAGELAELCARLQLLVPPGFASSPAPVRTEGVLRDGAVHPSVGVGLTVTCCPQVGVLTRCSAGDVVGAFGIRGDLGGSLLRAGDSEVEVGAWPAGRLAHEIARAVPALPGASQWCTVVAPPRVVGQVGWRLTGEPVDADDLGALLAPLIAAALA